MCDICGVLPCDATMMFFDNSYNELCWIVYTTVSWTRCSLWIISKMGNNRNLNIEIRWIRLNLKLRLACCKVSFELTIVTEVNDEAWNKVQRCLFIIYYDSYFSSLINQMEGLRMTYERKHRESFVCKFVRIMMNIIFHFRSTGINVYKVDNFHYLVF